MKNQGFSLVELSVVLVIIGLIVGGITGGQHLMQAAKLDKAITEISGYAKAIENFKQKYNAYPGDMPNATAFWGTYNSSTNPNGTTNGDGNESIGGENISSTETLKAWQQLAAAGFITGKYTGVASTPKYVAGTNLPESAITGAVYVIESNTATIFGSRKRALQLTKINSTGTQYWDSALSASDAQLIDKKIDDGNPSNGKLFGLVGNNSANCTSPDFNTTTTTASYVLTAGTSVICRLWYPI